MHFDLDDDERALQEGVRDLVAGRFPIEWVQAQEGQPLDRGRWRELGAAGVFALRLPEEEGGLGAGLTQAAVVVEEVGRALVPGPVIATHLAAGLVEGAATGDRVVGLIERDRPPLLVEHRDDLDVLLVLDADGVTAIDPGGLDAIPVTRPLDPLTPLHEVAELPGGDLVADAAGAGALRRDAAVLTAAYLTGIAAATTERATAHAAERHQFGRPIGAFQAVKHLVADMLVRTEVARAAVHAAAVTVDDPTVGDPDRATHAAKLLASRYGVANGEACVQVHGGMGFTWEVPMHLYLKRAVVLAATFGGADEHAEAVAARLSRS